ncbi:MAG TPA: radical SAM protein [Cyclobacteriaceae bacterium]|nr:radical SAM protein [Cyclobacteriaceae bacterium]
MLSRTLNFITNKIHELPVLVMMPHSSCNCRCVMCDIWKANSNKRELATEEIERHLPAIRKLNVREVVLSGGEALMHNNLWKLCEMLRKSRIKVTLLSTGLLLRKYATEVAENIDEVIVSLDGSREIHDKIRNVPKAFDSLMAGVLAIRLVRPTFRVTGRCVLQRYNYFDLENIVRTAKDLPLDQISFLAADVSTSAFNHIAEKENDRIHEIALTLTEAKHLQNIIESSFDRLEGEYLSNFIAESPGKMRKIVKYYLATAGEGKFEAPQCNAPWVSAVLESDGRLMPCFFHGEYGNIYDNDLEGVLNSEKAIDFRKKLNVRTNEICSRCVCSLKLPVV